MAKQQDYDQYLDEQYGGLKINLVKHDSSPTGLPAYIEAHLGENPKDKGTTAKDLGNYIYRLLGLVYQHTPEYRGKGKSTTLRWFMSWKDIAPILPNIYKAAGKKYPGGNHVPFGFQSLIIQDPSRGVFPRYSNPSSPEGRHTAAPWHAERDAVGELSLWDADDNNLLASESDLSIEEREANAHLMASAPLLFVNLCGLLAWIEHAKKQPVSAPHMPDDKYLKTAYDALKAAEGIE